MAVLMLTENSILVYDFAPLRSKIPFDEKIMWVHDPRYAPASLNIAYSGQFVQKDQSRTLNCSVDKNQSMRQRRIGLDSFQILLWALVVGDYFNIKRPFKEKKNHPSHRRKHAQTLFYQSYF